MIYLENGKIFSIIRQEEQKKLLSGESVPVLLLPEKEVKTEITADELLPQIICVGAKGEEARETWYLLTSFPEELSLPDTVSDEDRLLKRFKDNYTAFVGEMSMQSPKELFDRAEEITAVKEMYAWVTDFGWSSSYTAELLKSDNPLQVLADTWQHYVGFTSDDEVDLVLSHAATFCSEESDGPEQSM